MIDATGTLDGRLYRALGPLNLYVTVIGGFALLSLGVAALGVFAVLSRNVASHEREIGIRLAIGATPEGVFWSVLQNGMGLIVRGAVLALPSQV